MQKLLLILLVGMSALTQAFAQLDLDPKIQKKYNAGVAFHDKGQYEEAIKVYQDALDQSTKYKSLFYYEMAFSYYAWGKKDKAEGLLLKSIEADDYNLTGAYILLSTYYDESGDGPKAVKVLDEGIAKCKPHYLLFYNQGTNYQRLKKFRKAEEYLMKALVLKSSHPNSNYSLSIVEMELEHRTQALLAAYKSILSQGSSPRAPVAYGILRKCLFGGIEINQAKKEVVVKPGVVTEYKDIERDVDTQHALLVLESFKKKDKISKDELFNELFFELTKTLFKAAKANIKKGFWHRYIQVFTLLEDDTHLRTFCHLINDGHSEYATKWVKDNPDAIKSMFEYMEQQAKKQEKK